MFYFFKALAIVTISYYYVWSSEKKSWHLAFKSSWIGIVYNIACIVFFLPMSLFNISNYKNNDLNQYPQQKLLYIIFLFLFNFGNVFISIIFILKHSKMESIANKIKKLNELTTSNSPLNKKIFIFFFVNYLISFLIAVLILFNSEIRPLIFLIAAKCQHKQISSFISFCSV